MSISQENQDRLIEAAEWLRSVGVVLYHGVPEEELRKREEEFGFTFPPDYRWFLSRWLPMGRGFPDWRGPDEIIESQIARPVQGIQFDVVQARYWRPEWGARPKDDEAATEIAAARVGEVAPTLIPVFGHVYIPALPSEPDNPVFSVYQTDIIHAGANLAEYFLLMRRYPDHDVDNERWPPYSKHYRHIPFWTEMVRENVTGDHPWWVPKRR